MLLRSLMLSPASSAVRAAQTARRNLNDDDGDDDEECFDEMEVEQFG